MSSTWEHKPLGDLLVVQNGYAFNSKEFSAKDGMPLIRIRDIKEGITTETNYTGEYDAKFIVKDGDLLIGMDGEFGCYKWKGPDALLNQRVCRLQEFSDDLVPQFLLYGINKYLKDIEDVTTFTTVKHLSSKTIKEIEFPVPPKEDQQRIVAILDEAFAGIATATANAEKNLQNARELFESSLQSVFAEKGEGWVDSPLCELCSIKHGFAFKSQFFTSEGDYVLLTPGNFYEEGGYRDRGEKQKYYVGEMPDEYILKEGDFLIAMTEQAAGLLGSSIIVPESNRFLHNQRLGLVEIKPGVVWNNEFFFHQFNTRKFRQAVHDSASGVKVRHTSPKKLGEVVVSFPKSAKAQKFIADRLNELHAETKRLDSIYRKKLNELAALKQSLLRKAFAGELH